MKNKLLDNLKLLNYLQDVFITRKENGYIIELKHKLKNSDPTCQPILAQINDDGKIYYCMTNLYDNGCNTETIDMQALAKLQEIVEHLIK